MCIRDRGDHGDILNLLIITVATEQHTRVLLYEQGIILTLYKVGGMHCLLYTSYSEGLIMKVAQKTVYIFLRVPILVTFA